MPVDEENKELRDLVAETLKAKGVLGKVQAEIRASVFLALEEQDVFRDKSPFLNKPLKDFIKTQDGYTVISLVREFLEFFNLEFTSMVFEPETHAGVDYTYEGRSKLADQLNIDTPPDVPLLAHVFALCKNVKDSKVNSPESNLTVRPNNSDLITLSPEISGLTNGLNGDVGHNKKKYDVDKQNIRSNGDATKANTTKNMKDKPKTDDSLTSLSNLPPLNHKNLSFSNHKSDDLKALIDLGLSSKYDQSVSDSEKQTKSSSKSDSEESEIEEEIPSHNSNMSGVTAISIPGLGITKDSCNTTDGSVNTVCEELQTLNALSLSFVKDIPMKLINSHLLEVNKEKHYSDTDTSRTDDQVSKCETISEVDDIEDEISFTPSTIKSTEKQTSNDSAPTRASLSDNTKSKK